MEWECDGCKRVVSANPLGHSDFGGKITVCGPPCDDPECLDFGMAMSYVGDDDETAQGEG